LSAKLVPTFTDRGVSRGQRDGSLQPYSRISRPEPLLLQSSYSTVLARLSGPLLRHIIYIYIYSYMYNIHILNVF
jgi:hypothetical protein